MCLENWGWLVPGNSAEILAVRTKHKRLGWTRASIQTKVNSENDIVKFPGSWLEMWWGFFSKEIECQKGKWESLSHILDLCMFGSGVSPNRFCWSGAGALSPPAWCIHAHPSRLPCGTDHFKTQKQKITPQNGRCHWKGCPRGAVCAQPKLWRVPVSALSALGALGCREGAALAGCRQ